MEFKGPVEYIGCYEAEEGWCIDVMFRDAAVGKPLHEALGHAGNSPHLIVMMIPTEECRDNWLLWIIRFLSKHLGRDQELRAYIAFDLEV